jgi:Leucine-rich repeat (LRR) protein
MKISFLVQSSFYGMENLFSLDLYNNFVKAIPTNAFFGLNKLSLLNLSNNTIYLLETGCFNGLPNLKTIDLSLNTWCGVSASESADRPGVESEQRRARLEQRRVTAL